MRQSFIREHNPFDIADQEFFQNRFEKLSGYMKIKIPDYIPNLSAEEHLMNLEIDLYSLSRIYEKNSPSITIQRVFRGYQLRKKLKIIFEYRSNAAVKIQKVWKGTFQRKYWVQQLEEMAIENNGDNELMLNAA